MEQWEDQPLEEAIFQLSQAVYRREGDTHIIAFARLKVELAFSKIESSKEIKAWMEVRSQWPATASRLYDGTFNLSGPRSRSEMAKYLTGRCAEVPDWIEVLEQSCYRIFDVLREGDPIVQLGTIPRREGSRFRVEPICFEGLPVIWFGKGGSGKSTIAAATAIAVHGNWDLLGMQLESGPVLICDWETDVATYDEQVRLISVGMNIEVPGIHYRACSGSLRHEAESIGRFVDREGVKLVIIDSLGYACGGNKNDQDTATGMFSAMRHWGVSTICIDHIAKDEAADTPYGSVYFENSARATWRVRGAVENNEVSVSMMLEKSNLGRYQPVGFKLRFGPDMTNPESIVIERQDVREMPAMVEHLPSKVRIRTALINARESMTITDIGDVTGLREVIVRARIAEMTAEIVVIPIKGAANRYALKSAREE